MDAQRQTIERLYQAFARLDTDTMADCYAPDATFDDEAFSLKGRREVMGMWTMLCDATRAKGQDVWRLEWSGVQAEGSAAARTGRRGTASAPPAAWCTTASTPPSASRPTAASPSSATASTSGAGRGRRSARRACCSGGRRCCATRCARQAAANLRRHLERKA
jgi:hypothetical protein